jgi:hypothetical protein
LSLSSNSAQSSIVPSFSISNTSDLSSPVNSEANKASPLVSQPISAQTGISALTATSNPLPQHHHTPSLKPTTSLVTTTLIVNARDFDYTRVEFGKRP